MRKCVFALLAVMLVLGCTKEKIATEPCSFTITIDQVTGSKMQATIVPENEHACYVYSLIGPDYPQYNYSDAELADFELAWMEDMYQTLQKAEGQASFMDLFGYKGPRTIRSLQLKADNDFRLIVFQINPETRKAIGPVYKTDFRTKPIRQSDLRFKVQYGGDQLRIIPSNDSETWFWEYEKDAVIRGSYYSPYFFYYSVIDMYAQYGFLENQICQGPDEWSLTRDDKSFKADTVYTLCVSGCEDGEITTDVQYLDFIYRDGQIAFVFNSDEQNLLLEPLN